MLAVAAQQKAEETGGTETIAINRLLQGSVIILKGGLFMKESQIRKQAIKPRHAHAGAQLRSLHPHPTHGQLHGTSVAMWY